MRQAPPSKGCSAPKAGARQSWHQCPSFPASRLAPPRGELKPRCGSLVSACPKKCEQLRLRLGSGKAKAATSAMPGCPPAFPAKCPPVASTHSVPLNARAKSTLVPTLESLRELLKVGGSRPRREVVVDAQKLEGSLWGSKHLLLRGQSGHHCRPIGKGSNPWQGGQRGHRSRRPLVRCRVCALEGRTLQRTSPRALFSHAT